jgi:hypothetical protein
MLVLVSPAAGSGARAAVGDSQDLTRLSVEFRDVSDAAAAAALGAAGLGQVDGDHVWLEVSALRAAGDRAGDWGTRFDGMLGYAQRQGWTDEELTRVRAHIVRT